MRTSRSAKGSASSRRSRARASSRPGAAPSSRWSTRGRSSSRLQRSPRFSFAEPARAVKEHHFVKEISAGLTHIARTRVLRELTIGLATALLVAGFSETLDLRRDERRAPSLAVLRRRDRHGAGDRRDRRRRHLGLAHAPHRRRAPCRHRRRALRHRRPLLDGAERADRARVDRGRRRRHRLGGRLALDRVPAPQPERGAGPRRGRGQHALQRPADDRHRRRGCAHHARRFQGRNRDDDRRLLRLRRLPADAPARGDDGRRSSRRWPRDALDPLWRNRDFVLLQSGSSSRRPGRRRRRSRTRCSSSRSRIRRRAPASSGSRASSPTPSSRSSRASPSTAGTGACSC